VPERFATMANAIEIEDPTPEGFLRWLADLKAEISVPRSLLDTTVDRDELPRLAEVAFADSCHLNNPREVTQDDFTAIFTKAFD